MEHGQVYSATISGDAGVGKSRLLHEYTGWLELQAVDTWFFKGRAFSQSSGIPFALLRDMFAFRFRILDSDAMPVVREKILAGMAQMMGLPEDLLARQMIEVRAHFMGALLGYDFSDSPHVAAVMRDPRQLYE